MKSPKNTAKSLNRSFAQRHIGPDRDEIEQMLETIDADSVDQLIEETIPPSLLSGKDPNIGHVETEQQLLEQLRNIASRNETWRSFIGMGYRKVETPPVIQRNILENPQWYTHYTPYQSEISQGRLEALLNFQTMVSDLTGLEIANASLLDEATACAEAMSLMYSNRDNKDANRLVVSEGCHPQNIAVVETRAKPLGIDVDVTKDPQDALDDDVFGVILQYPTTDGKICNYNTLCETASDKGILVTASADLLALTMIEAPGAFGADVAVGNTQRFGVPLGFGGPHAAYFATRESFKRDLPGRLVGVSKDDSGEPALRLALQTREQHIRRERATSNICTAQVLLAVMASCYGVYHGPEGLKNIAKQVHLKTKRLKRHLEQQGFKARHDDVFDTLRIETTAEEFSAIKRRARNQRVNLRYYDDETVGLSIDEATTDEQLRNLARILTGSDKSPSNGATPEYTGSVPRQADYLEHENFSEYQTETEFVRYVHRLAKKDLSLTDSMIPLGSCTMKLNGTAELLPISWPAFNQVHPYAPTDQNRGYLKLFDELETQLSELTGLPAVSLQPNSGAQGEYAGLLAIREFHRDADDEQRIDCLIPESAHGTNAASAVMAGMNCVSIDCDERGSIDLEDLRSKAQEHSETLAGIMITYPSTHGVFEQHIEQICDVVHEFGGLVYMDGANMNAQLGLCYPADYGVDICHLNLHKTFSIPHGGGGPGMGPVCATEQLKPYLPDHPLDTTAETRSPGPVSAAPWGSASILPISWAYIKLMGTEGLKDGSKAAILNANYMAARLDEGYDVLYSGKNNRVAHEFILDTRPFRRSVDISVQDISKRLIDYGFHAPTMSWPVRGTMMIEPTESESKKELDAFCDSLLSIRSEIEDIENGLLDPAESPLTESPHTAETLTTEDWDRSYSREDAVSPSGRMGAHKFWPSVGRVDDAYGDRNLMCTCQSLNDAFFEN
jgi:glycine dehydrogenase